MQRLTTTDKLLNSPPGTAAMEFNRINDVEVRADITHPFNKKGTSIRKVGPVLPRMMDVLEDWVTDLERFSSKKLEAIVLCSVWRQAKPGEKVNRHAEGLAIDIGGIWWPDEAITAWDYGSSRKRSIATEAVCRMHYGTTLGPASNQDHDNHWHCDIGKEAGITPEELAASQRKVRKIEVVYVQDACNTVHGADVGRLDGWWGPKTEAGVNRVLADLEGCDPDRDITQAMTYYSFNLATALVGFDQVEQG